MKKYILYVVAALWITAFVWATVAHADDILPSCQQYCNYDKHDNFGGPTIPLPPVVVPLPPEPPQVLPLLHHRHL